MAPVPKVTFRPPYVMRFHSPPHYLLITTNCLLLVFFIVLIANCFIIYDLCGGERLFFFFHLCAWSLVWAPRIILAHLPPLLLGSPCAFLGFWFKNHFREHFPHPRLSQIPVLCFHNPLNSHCHSVYHISQS